jgi:hypothetical protein
MTQPRLDHLPEGRVAIVGAGVRVELSGPAALRVGTWHEHMRTHGEAEAAIYLAGVIDGLRAANAMRIEQVVADAQRRLSEGQAMIDAHRARREISGENNGE